MVTDLELLSISLCDNSNDLRSAKQRSNVCSLTLFFYFNCRVIYIFFMTKKCRQQGGGAGRLLDRSALWRGGGGGGGSGGGGGQETSVNASRKREPRGNCDLLLPITLCYGHSQSVSNTSSWPYLIKCGLCPPDAASSVLKVSLSCLSSITHTHKKSKFLFFSFLFIRRMLNLNGRI